MSHKLF